MTDLTVTTLPAAPLHALEIWSHPAAVGARFQAALGAPLPAIGRSLELAAMRLIRFEPTVWLVEGDIAGLADLLNYAAVVDDGVIVGKNGALMAAWLYQGDDSASSTDEQREIVSYRINQALAGLGIY